MVSIGVDDGDFVYVGDVLVCLDKSNVDVVLVEVKVNLVNIVCKVCGLYNFVIGV